MAKIPRLKINLSAVMNSADAQRDLLTYDSKIYGAGYATDKKEILIITGTRGYLRITNEEAEKLINELKYIIENNDRFGR